MKKPLIYILFSLAFVFLFSSTVSADIIAYITGPMVDKYEAYQINNNECLTKGYKFNSLSIYWTTKEKFNSIDLKNLKLADMTLLLENIEPSGGYISDSNPLVKEDVEYSIAGFSNGKLIFYKSKQTSEYNNGSQKKIETFNSPLINQEPKIQNPQPNKITPTPTPSPKITPTPSDQPIVIPTPEPVRRGFWQSISCFFSGLFGRGCR